MDALASAWSFLSSRPDEKKDQAEAAVRGSSGLSPIEVATTTASLELCFSFPPKTSRAVHQSDSEAVNLEQSGPDRQHAVPTSGSKHEQSGRPQHSSHGGTSSTGTFPQGHRATVVGVKLSEEEISFSQEGTSGGLSAETKRVGDVESRPGVRSDFLQAKQTRPWWGTIVLAYQTLGVVYGDLATSPLYVFPTINLVTGSETVYLGILSIVFWTLTLIGLVKYTLIVLQADDHGEGGTFAVYSLLCRHAKIGQHSYEDSQQVFGRRVSHYPERLDYPKGNRVKRFLENSVVARRVLLFTVMMGTCMLVGDGILTPAISVLSAIEGIKTAAPSLSKAVILVITAVILVLLFMSQRYGTRRFSLVFSPIMAIWLISTSVIGIYNIAVHYPRVFKAFSPAYIYYLFNENKKDAWLMLGGTVLCITGAEAMYADLGHFDKRSIQVAFSTMVYPSVLLTYSGQTAYLIKHPHDHRDGFFKMIPRKVYWPMFVVATLAAIVASQGLISATFSVIRQSTALDYFPRVKVVYTSDERAGQVYSPEVNYAVMFLCLAVVFGFRSAVDIGNAFGVAVVFVMLFTTFLICLVMLVIWETSVFLVIPYFLLYVLMEGTYMTAVVTKVPQGGWLPFAISIIVALIMVSWNMGCQKKFKYEMRNEISKEEFGDLLAHVCSVRVPGICFFYTNLLQGVPPIIGHYVKNVRSLHRVLVFISIQRLPVKTVLPAERFLVGRVGFPGVYRCIARYGYTDVSQMRTDEFVNQFVETLSEYIMSSNTRHSSSSCTPSARDESLTRLEMADELAMVNEVEELKMAKADGPVYVLGRGELAVGKTTTYVTRIFVGIIYRFLEVNCRSPVSYMDIPYAQFLELGMLYDI